MVETRSEISLQWNKTICVVGARNMGKTNLAQVLLLMKNGLAKSCDLILLFGKPRELHPMVVPLRT